MDIIKSLPQEKCYIRIRLKVKDVVPMNERLLIENFFLEHQAILCEIQPIREATVCIQPKSIAVEEIKNISPLDIATDYYQQHFGGNMDEELLNMLRESIDKVEKEYNKE